MNKKASVWRLFITMGYAILFLLSTNVHNIVHILFVK